MSQHTPGPWQVNHFDQTQVCDSDGESRGCSPIAFVAPIGPLVERKANARLISAAPDLLDALQHLMTAHGEQLDWAFQQAQDAIAKATGETP